MKLKSILLVMLALCLTICLCACGDDTASDDNKAETKTTIKTTQSTESEGTTTAASATVSTSSSADANVTETDPSTNDTTANDATTTTTATAPIATQPVDGKANYTVIVTDEAGNPIPGAFVQICLEACIPCMTNAQGIASFNNMDVADYKVSFINVPAGYEKPADNFYFEKDTYEMTLVLKAAN